MAANPYSIEEIAPRTLEEQDAQANPYSITTLNAEGAQLRATLSDATRADPAQARQADVLARQQGLPQDTVLRNLRDVSLQHAVDEADRRLKTDPLLLQKFKTQPFYAKQAQDDLDAQLEISKLVRNWGKPELGVGSFFGTAAKSLPLAYDTTREGIRTQMYDVLNAAGLIESTPEELRKVRLGLEKAQSAANMNSPNFDDANLSTFERATLQAVHGGFGSTFQQAPGIAASILLANPAPALALMGLQSQTQAYGKYKLRGATPGEAFVGGSLEGAIEVGTEMAPMKYLVKSFGKVGLSKFVAGLFGREVLTEQMATAGQDFVDTMVANPNKTIAQYLEERPGAAYQTLVSTITQSLLMGGASAIVNRMATDAQKSQWAEEEQQKLASMFAVAATSTMKEGNPLSFAETVQEMAAASEGAPKSVFVDARALLEMQQSAGLTDEVFFQMLPSAREKLAEAAIDNGVVELPIGEVTSTVPGSKIEQAFLQQVRMDPTAPNEIERTEAASTAESYLAEQADKVVAEAENAQATLDSADVVRQEVIKQLEATKRFPLEKSQRYADLHAAFFTVLAGKLGITPEQAFKKYGASVRSTISPGQVYNGAPRRKPGEISVEGVHFSKEARTSLSGAMYGSNYAGSGKEAILNAKDERLRKRVYFYANKGTGINPEAGVGGFAHKANLTNIYDANSDPLRLRKGGQQAFESAVLDAGFSGYLDRLEGTQSGQVILLGDQNVAVEQMGATTPDASAVPAPAARESLGRDIIIDALAANKTLPAGSPTIERWQEILPDDIKQALAEAGVFDGDQQRTAYKSELAAAYAAATEAPVYGQVDTRTAAFKDWFGDSKVVDADGKPLVVYHGTRQDFSAFDAKMAGSATEAESARKGFFFANRARTASDYTNMALPHEREAHDSMFNEAERLQKSANRSWSPRPALKAAAAAKSAHASELYSAAAEMRTSGGNIMPVYLSLQNPMVFDMKGKVYREKTYSALIDEAIAKGHDGLVIKNTYDQVLGDALLDDIYVAFQPNQIKSVFNHGTFDPNDPNILKQTVSLRDGRETLKKYGLTPGKKYKTREVAAALEARQRAKYGQIAKDDRSPETAKKLAKWMAEEVLFEMEQPGASGVGWYSEKFQKALDIMAGEFPELATDKQARDLMTAIIAITSDGQKVRSNFLQALGIYKTFKDTGKFATERGHQRQASIAGNLKTLQRLHDDFGPERMHTYLMREMTVGQLKAAAKAAGLELNSDYQVSVKMPMAALELGPKLGAFYANLMGADGYLTMDRWWSRTFNRYRGVLLDAPTRQGLDRFKELLGDPSMSDDAAISATVEPTKAYEDKGFKHGTEIEKAANTLHKAAFDALNDAPFNATDRTFMLDTVARAKKMLASKGIDISVADIQAALWYYEKRLYGELGARQTADTSYEDAARRVVAERTAGGPSGPDLSVVEPGLDDFDAGPAGDVLQQQAPEGPATLNIGLAIPAGGELTPAEVKAAVEAFGVKVTDSAVVTSDTEPTLVAQLDRALSPEDMDALSRALGQEAIPQLIGNEGTMHGPEKDKWGDFNPYYFRDLKGDRLSEVLGQSRDLFPGEFANKRTTVPTQRVISSKGEVARGGNINSEGRQITATKQGLVNFWNWFGDSVAVDSLGKPLEMVHSTNADTDVLRAGKKTINTYGLLGPVEVTRGGIFVSPSKSFSQKYLRDGAGQNVMPLYVRTENPLDLREGLSASDTAALEAAGLSTRYVINAQHYWELFDNADDGSNDFIEGLKRAGYDSAIFNEASPDEGNGGETWVVFDSEQIKSAIGNRGTFDPNDPNILKQNKPDPLGTFNPSTLEISLLADANLSTFLHETGHFFLEVLGRVAAEPNAPKEIVDEMNATLKWFGVKDIETWNSLSFAEREPHHEKWAESFEQYLLEGKAPSLALRQSFQRFKEFLLGVYKSLKQFLATHRGEASGQDGAFAQPPQIDTKAFKAWFGDSKVVGAEGKPLVVYHGTTRDFSVFRTGDASYRGNATQELGAWFAADNLRSGGGALAAEGFANDQQDLDGGPTSIYPAHLSIKNPVEFDDFGALQSAVDDAGGTRQYRAALEAAGHDGIVIRDSRTDGHGSREDWVAFHPNQIKSAIGNQGTFDPNDPNILKQGGKPAGPGLNDEVRAIFDRLLATEEQIKEAEAQARFEEIFKSAKDAGMTEDEWKAYQAQHQDATQDALEKMGKLSLADTKWFVAARSKALREAQAAVADKRAEMKAQVTAEVMALPVEQARAEIANLRASTPEQKAALKSWNEARAGALAQAKEELTAALVAANPDAKGIGKGQLLAKNKRAIANQAEAAALEWEKAHPRPKAMPATLEMEMMAERLGYTSADHLRKDMLESPSAKDLIEAMTEQRLLETYGNLVTREGIEQAANEAVYNEARGRFVATELGAMQGAMSKTGPTGKTNRAGKPINVNVITQAAKTFAETVVNRRKIMDLKPAQHTAAAARAAGKAAKLQAAGKTAEAIAAKRDQLLSHFTALYAFKAERNIASQLAYLKKFDNEGTRKSIPQDYLDQIDAMLEKIDLRKGTSAKDIARRQSLAEWIDQQHEEGKSPILPPAVLADAQLTSYKQMTVEEFAGLVDSIQNIEHLGRLKGKLLKSADKRAWEAIRDEIVGTIRKFGGKAKPDSLEPRGALNQWVHGFWADHRKLDSLAYQMDGGDINGPMFRSFIRGMNDSGAYKASEIAKATQALADIYAPVWALPGGTAGDVQFIPEINNSLSRGGRLAVALNWGNPQNRQRLMQTGVGAPWSEAQVEAILRTLAPTELKFVNDTWAYLDSFWPAVKAKQQRVSGVVEEKIEAVPFDVVAADGTTVHMRGGYYPLVYDNDRSNAAAKRDAMQVAKEMLRGAIGAATTRRGHTKARVENVNEPLRLSLSVITQHVEQVVHDLAWHEWMIDANKILADKQIAAAIKEHYGPEILKTMKANIDGIATGDLTSQTSLDNILLQLKTNLSRAVMGWSMTTALMQPFGLAQSVARVGVAPILKGAGRWAGDAAQMESSMTWIREKSSFMEHRAQTMNREINDISQRVRGKSKTMQVIDRSLFILMQKMQLVADVPTWIGMYERATAEGYDEATSVALADEAVKGSQGGGQAQDLANVQRKHPFLTMFYSYFSTTLNLVAEKTAAADFKSPSAVAGWLADMALLVTLPAILPNLLAYAMKGGDDDDPEGWAKRLAKWQASYLLGLFVGLRELGGMVEGFDYAGPPVGRVIVDAGKTATQLAQGDLDEAAVTSLARVMGDLFGIPSTQLIRSYKGWQAWADGDAPVTAVLMGPPPKH